MMNAAVLPVEKIKRKGRTLRTFESGDLEVLVSDPFLYTIMASYLLFTYMKFSVIILLKAFNLEIGIDLNCTLLQPSKGQ